jgi:SAM-dependent methyltransferase
MNHEENKKSIKYYLKRYLFKHRERFTDKTVIDFPAGNGITSKNLKEIGAQPLCFDLFPEYFKMEGIKCERANINEGIPVADEQADFLICQEGIEHFTDQLASLKEFNRVLKMGGGLIITTPNYSNMRAKMSYLLSESERFNSILAPNELDSIWMSKQDITNEVYYGHIFLIGILKLRCIARLAGFKIKHIEFTRIKSTALILTLVFYPFILLSNWFTYRKRMAGNKEFDTELKKEVYKEIFNLSINPKILVDGHLFVEFEKTNELNEIASFLKSKHKEFGTT